MDSSSQYEELKELFNIAEKFVKNNYVTADVKDKNIKVLATMNQLIELKKLNLNDQNFQDSITLAKQVKTEYLDK